MITIRNELPIDIPQVRCVNELAFGRPAEADVVDRLRVAPANALSLVALEDEMVVGHPEYYPRFGFERASAARPGLPVGGPG